MYISCSKYDNCLLKVPIYMKHPQMIPFIGDKWGQKKTLLAIGESNYLSKLSDAITHDHWYDITKNDLIPEDVAHTSIRDMITKDIRNKNFATHSMFSRIDSILKTEMTLQKYDFSGFEYIAYMNYFMRPAFNGKDLQLKKKAHVI